jgi:hypothetical protein
MTTTTELRLPTADEFAAAVHGAFEGCGDVETIADRVKEISEHGGPTLTLSDIGALWSFAETVRLAGQIYEDAAALIHKQLPQLDGNRTDELVLKRHDA